MKQILTLLALLICSPAFASYDCDGNNDVLEAGAAVVSGYPFTVAGWVKPQALGVTGSRPFALGTDGSEDDWYVLHRTTDDRFRVVIDEGGTFTGVNSGSLNSTTTWFHIIAVFASSTDVRAYVDGGSQGSMNPGLTPAAPNQTHFCETMTNSNDFDGKIAHFGVWDIALDATARTALAGGGNPLAVEAANLQAYWPMLEDANDDKGAFHLTVTGATLDGADNPTVDAPPSASGALLRRRRN